MRLALFRREPAAWYRGVERPDVEVLNSLAAVTVRACSAFSVVAGSALGEHDQEPTRLVFMAASRPGESRVVTCCQTGQPLQVLQRQRLISPRGSARRLAVCRP